MPPEYAFPNLLVGGYRLTSPVDPLYNCIAWATGEDRRWWWPDPMGIAYWPAGVPCEETVAAFETAYHTLGYTPTTDAALEPATEKIAVYARFGVPTHASRQLPNGKWTSKLGESEDIEHDLDGLTRSVYGNVALILKRPVV